nr:hypothetical protein [Pseudomonas sp. B26(2017)]
MDTMSRREIGDLLSRRLPQCTITCSINADGSLSVEVIDPVQRQFTIGNIDHSRYHGEAGINRLLREILEERIIPRRSTNLD